MKILPREPGEDDVGRCIAHMWEILAPVRPKDHGYADELELVRRCQRLLFESKRDGALDGFALVQVINTKHLHM